MSLLNAVDGFRFPGPAETTIDRLTRNIRLEFKL